MKSAILICLCVASVSCLEKQITVNIEPRRQDYFFQSVKEKEVLELDYQVIDGGHGDLDITFHVIDPNGRILVADFQKSGNTHRFDAQSTGDYTFCFDNGFSTYNAKTVFFAIVVDNDENFEDLNPEEVHELKVQDMQIINNVRSDLNKVRQLQEMMKSSEARDRNIAAENNFKVGTFSLFQIIVMVMVGLVQIVMVRVTRDMFRKITMDSKESSWLVAMSEGLPKAEDDVDDADDGVYKSINPAVVNKKKTLKQQRKQKEQTKIQETGRIKRLEKKKTVDIHKLRLIAAAIEKHKKELREVRNAALLENEPKRPSKLKYEEPDVEFNLAKDIACNLKNVKKEGDLLAGRFRSMQKRNILEVTTKQIRKKAKVQMIRFR